MASSRTSLPLLQSFRPRSFADRGLAAPFTTPLLLGARLRRTGAEMEVLVPNPSGGRGVYLLPWADITSLCRPTMHDTVLGQTLAEEAARSDGPGGLTPSLVAEIATDIAIRGLAGDAVAAQARLEAEQVSACLAETRAGLLRRITAQVEATMQPQGPSLPPVETATPAELEVRGLAALTVLARLWDHPPGSVVNRLDQMAGLAATVGPGGAGGAGAGGGIAGRMIASLGQLRQELQLWAEDPSRQTQTAAIVSGLGRSASPEAALAVATRNAAITVHAADLATRMGQALLDAARERLQDLCGTLHASLADPVGVDDILSRPVWLLDGWPQILRCWRAAPSIMSRTQALHDMAGLLPILPEEVAEWLGEPGAPALPALAPHAPDPADAVPFPVIDHRLLATSERVARLEQVRGMAWLGAA